MEPHCPQQNKAKRTIQELKKNVNRIMDCTETPMFMWLCCMLFTTMIMNVLAMKKHDWRTPTEMALGYTSNVSAFLQFEWWEQVYYLDDDGTGFPNSKENIGHWCGPTENCGDALTNWIYTQDTKQLIARSVVRTACNKAKTNKQAGTSQNDTPTNPNSKGGEEGKEGLVSLKDLINAVRAEKGMEPTVAPVIDPTNLLGYNCVREHNGVQQRATVVDVDTDLDKVTLEFMNGSKELLDYHEMINVFNAGDKDGDQLWTFKEILAHRKQGRDYELQILRDTG